MVNLQSWNEDDRRSLEHCQQENSKRLKTELNIIVLGKANASDLSNIVLTLIFFILFLLVEKSFPVLSLYFPVNYLLAFAVFYGVAHLLVNHTIIERYLNNFESAYVDCIRRSYSEMYLLEANKNTDYQGLLVVYFEEEHVVFVLGSKALIKSNSQIPEILKNHNLKLQNMRHLDRSKLLQMALNELSL